jgi:hypothetical protein
MVHDHSKTGAFPRPTAAGGNMGLTIREYIAAAALQGLLANGTGGDAEQSAEDSIKHADVLIDKLAKC